MNEHSVMEHYIKTLTRAELEKLVLAFGQYFSQFGIDADIRFKYNTPYSGPDPDTGFYHSNTGEKV
jgi:hypothetical protein